MSSSTGPKLPDFKKFCDSWLEEFQRVKDAGGSNQRLGKAFENKWLEILTEFFKAPPWAVKRQLPLGGMKWDLALARSQKPAALFEVKHHGFYSYKSIGGFRQQLAEAKRADPSIRPFYITFRETNTYDRKVREILGNEFVSCYYRLSDSGDGIQAVPNQFYPSEWKRLEADLRALLK